MIEYVRKKDALNILAKHYVIAWHEIDDLKPSFTIDACRVIEEGEMEYDNNNDNKELP